MSRKCKTKYFLKRRLEIETTDLQATKFHTIPHFSLLISRRGVSFGTLQKKPRFRYLHIIRA